MMKAALAIFLMAALIAGFVRLAPVAVRAACSATGGARERIAAVQKACRAEFPGRYFFVDLNGLYARCTGRRLCNNVRRLDGGMLVRAKVGETLDPARCAAGVADIAGEHAARGARVVYVQLPGKPDGGAERLRAAADALLATLASSGVETLDLRGRYAGSPELLERYFFRTDHHWNMDAVLDAAGVLAAALGDARALRPGGWVKRELPSTFLGSQGKRTGQWFAGVDSLSYYEPVRTGDYCIELAGGDGRTESHAGGFDVVLDPGILSSRLDVHEENAYKVYRGIGGIWPCVRYRHADADNEMRLAVIGDSFVRPLGALLSAAFVDVLVVDPRYPCGGVSVRRRVREFAPDVLIVAYNPYALVLPKGMYATYALFEFPEE